MGAFLFVRYRSWYLFRKIENHALKQPWVRQLAQDENVSREEAIEKIAYVVQSDFKHAISDAEGPSLSLQAFVWPLSIVVLALMALQSTSRGVKSEVLKEGLHDRVGTLIAKARGGRGKAEQGALSEIERDVEGK